MRNGYAPFAADSVPLALNDISFHAKLGQTIAENIAFGARASVSQAQSEAAAKEAQAHEFISDFPEVYETV